MKLRNYLFSTLFFFFFILIFSCGLLTEEINNSSSSADLFSTETNYQNIINFNEFFYDNDNKKLRISLERETPVEVKIQSLLILKFNNRITDMTNFSTILTDPISIRDIDIGKVADQVEIKSVYLNDRKYSVSKTFPIGLDFTEKKETVTNTISSNQIVLYKTFSNNLINNLNDILITEWKATNFYSITNYKDISITKRKIIENKIYFTNFVTVNYIDRSGQEIFENIFSNYYETFHYFTNGRINYKNDKLHYQYQSTNVGIVSNVAGGR